MLNKDDLVSIIVPVYNAEKYLDRCIKSIVGQTYSHLEIIIVDDGSKDESGKKCDDWAVKDSRIQVIHKQNSGVSDTRNAGIERAKGEYIAFVDSDDYLDFEYIDKLYGNILTQKADIVSCNFEAKYEAGVEERAYNLIQEQRVVSDCRQLFEDSINCKIYTYLVWGKLYKKELLQGICFRKQAYSEDALFIREIFIKSPKVSLMPYKGYYYCINSNCVTNDKSRRLEKSLGDLNMLWNTWLMCREQKLNVSYDVLEQSILRTLKGIIGKELKGFKALKEKECRLIKDITDNFKEFGDKGKNFRYLIPLSGIVRLLSSVKKKPKKKAGIITIYDLGNYGNRLQNYAVVRHLSDMGYHVETLIIQRKSIKWAMKEAAAFLKIRKKPSKHWNLQQESKEYTESLSLQDMQRYQLFKEFSYKYTNIRKISYWKEFPWPIKKQYDYFISGSDQVWNPTIGQAADWEFLSFSKREKNISWSASFGISEIPEKYRKSFRRYLKNIAHISVREDTAVKIINQLTGQKAQLLVDPTMMISADEWRTLEEAPKLPVPKRYILSFFLGGQDEKRREQIKALADKNGCEVLNLMDRDCEVLYKTGPAQFIYLIGHAALICTDSFHACVFSILADKSFYVFNRMGKGENMGSRITNLLEKFGLTDRMFHENKIREDNISHNYAHAYEILKNEQKKTNEFLKKALM